MDIVNCVDSDFDFDFYDDDDDDDDGERELRRVLRGSRLILRFIKVYVCVSLLKMHGTDLCLLL